MPGAWGCPPQTFGRVGGKDYAPLNAATQRSLWGQSPRLSGVRHPPLWYAYPTPGK